MPTKWNDLYNMLANKKSKNPSLPLILSAWWAVPALPKILRLKEHIEFAYKQGVWDEVDKFLRNLDKDDWAYGGGTDSYEEYKNNPIWNND